MSNNVSPTLNSQENINSSLPNCVDSLVNNIQEQNVQQKADKIIDDMLAKKNVDGESSGMAHVSISIANDEIDTIGMAKGIKKRQEKPRGKRKREQSWVEKLAGKTKKCSNSRNAPQQATIQVTQSSQVDSGTQHQVTIQGTQSSQVDNGTQHQVTN
ncbi:hypothetical protein P8452_28438 [Trifolium repens]|nr:hypothetical protein P8452_28438 [Trifolium repens]